MEKRRTYWQFLRAAERNSCLIGVATTPEHAQKYEAAGYIKMPREVAVRTMRLRSESDNPVHIDVSVDGTPVIDRFQAAILLKRPHKTSMENSKRPSL